MVDNTTWIWRIKSNGPFSEKKKISRTQCSGKAFLEAHAAVIILSLGWVFWQGGHFSAQSTLHEDLMIESG